MSVSLHPAPASSAHSPASTNPPPQPIETTPNQSEAPLLDNSTTYLEPPPQRPSVHTSGAATPHISSPSARTSFTRVDIPGEGEAAHPPAMSQDLQSTSDASPPPEQSESQGPLDGQHESVITSAAAPIEPETSVPMASTTAAAGADESSSQKALLQQEGPVPQIPQAFLTFLLVSGKRRTMCFEPETTIGRVKELIWNAWPDGKSHLLTLAVEFHTLVQIGKTNAHRHPRICACCI